MAEVKKPKRKGRAVRTASEAGRAEIERFCQAIMDGKSNAAAWRAVHPDAKANDASARELGMRWAHRPDVQMRLAELREDMASSHAAFRDRLVEMHEEEIARCWLSNSTLLPVIDVVKSLTKIAGYEQKTINVNAQVGAMDQGSVEDKLAFLAAKVAK